MQSQFSPLTVAALLLGTVLILVVAFAFVLEMKQSHSSSSNVAVDQGDVALLRARIASDEARLVVLEKGGPGTAATVKSALQQSQADLAELSTRVGKLESIPDPEALARLDDLNKQLATLRSELDFRIGNLERAASQSDLPQRMAAMTTAETSLDARVAKLEQSDPALTMRLAATELAFANLVRASGGSGPFATELQALRVLFPNTAEVAELSHISRRGAPTYLELRDSFPQVAAQALAAESSSHSRSWMGRLLGNIRNMIVIRRITVTEGNDSESILARAGARLDRADLAGTISELNALKGPARTTLQPWLNTTRARLAIERDVTALSDRLTKLLATR